jgi:hypothetical protein
MRPPGKPRAGVFVGQNMFTGPGPTKVVQNAFASVSVRNRIYFDPTSAKNFLFVVPDDPCVQGVGKCLKPHIEGPTVVSF